MRVLLPVPGGLLLHRFTLTHADMGGFISVALSVGLPCPGVTRHHCFVGRTFLGIPAAIQPPACSAPTWMGGLGQLNLLASAAAIAQSTAPSSPAGGAKMQAKGPQPRF